MYPDNWSHFAFVSTAEEASTGHCQPGTTWERKEIQETYIFEILSNARILALDLETTGLDPIQHDIRLITLATEQEAFCFGPEHIEAIRPILENPATTFLIQYAPFDMGFLYKKFGIQLARVYDTRAVERHLLAMANSKDSASLAPMAERYLGVELDKSLQTSFLDGKTFTEAQIKYAAIDALVLFPITFAQTFKRNFVGQYDPKVAIMYDYCDGKLLERPDTR